MSFGSSDSQCSCPELGMDPQRGRGIRVSPPCCSVGEDSELVLTVRCLEGVRSDTLLPIHQLLSMSAAAAASQTAAAVNEQRTTAKCQAGSLLLNIGLNFMWGCFQIQIKPMSINCNQLVCIQINI